MDVLRKKRVEDLLSQGRRRRLRSAKAARAGGSTALAGFVSLSTLATSSASERCSRSSLYQRQIPILRRTDSGFRRPFRVPWSPVIPIQSVLACLYLMNLTIATWLRFVVWLVIGLVVYLGYGHRHARVAENARFTDPGQSDLAGRPALK